jgi:hypothetical protein
MVGVVYIAGNGQGVFQCVHHFYRAAKFRALGWVVAVQRFVPAKHPRYRLIKPAQVFKTLCHGIGIFCFGMVLVINGRLFHALGQVYTVDAVIGR